MASMSTELNELVPYGKRASIKATVKLLLVLLLSSTNAVRFGILWLLFKRRRVMSLKLYMFAAASRTLLDYMRADDLQMAVGLKTLEAELQTPFYWRIAKQHLNFNQPLEVPKLTVSDKSVTSKCQWIHEVKHRGPDDPVIYFIHGGGFALAMTFAQIYWMRDLLKALSNKRVSILALNYSLTPYAKYPTQLNEALHGFESLAATCKNIITIGDSAGATLSAALALRLTSYPELQKHLYGQIYISPWAELLPPLEGTVSNNIESDWIVPMFGARCAGWYVGQEVDINTQKLPTPITDECCDIACATPARLREALPARKVCVWSKGEMLAEVCETFADKADITDRHAEVGTVHDVLYFGHNNTSSTFIIDALNKWLA